jgi:chemotaxis family two-component system response regulator Rcp1
MMTQTPGMNDASPVPAFAGESATEQYTVFLVEDDADDRRQIAEVLERSPYIHNIHHFGNADALKKHFAQEGYYTDPVLRRIPALILLDLHMPGTGGMDFLRELKGNPLTRDIPVIIITGDSSPWCTQEAFELQASAYVSKPVHLDYIHEVIHTGSGWPARHKKER